MFLSWKNKKENFFLHTFQNIKYYVLKFISNCYYAVVQDDDNTLDHLDVDYFIITDYEF